MGITKAGYVGSVILALLTAAFVIQNWSALGDQAVAFMIVSAVTIAVLASESRFPLTQARPWIVTVLACAALCALKAWLITERVQSFAPEYPVGAPLLRWLWWLGSDAAAAFLMFVSVFIGRRLGRTA